MIQSKLGNLLVKANLISKSNYEDIISTLSTVTVQKQNPGENLNQNQNQNQKQFPSFTSLLMEKKLISEDTLADFIVASSGFPRIVSNMILNFNDSVLPENCQKDLFYKFRCVPFAKETTIIHVAMSDPLDETLIKKIEFITSSKIKPFVAKFSQIQRSLDKYFFPEDILDVYLGYGSGYGEDGEDEESSYQDTSYSLLDNSDEDYSSIDTEVNLNYDISNLNIILTKIISSKSFAESLTYFNESVRQTVEYCGLFKIDESITQNISLSLKDSPKTSVEEAQDIITSVNSKISLDYVGTNNSGWSFINLPKVSKKAYLYPVCIDDKTVLGCIMIDDMDLMMDKIYLNIISDLIKALAKKYGS